MLNQSTEGCYLFLYDKVGDGPCTEDYLFDDIKDAKINANWNMA